jgi:tetratricopeptide (TPR) repeat protein
VTAAGNRQDSSTVARAAAAIFLAAVVVHLIVWLQYRADPFAARLIADALSYHHWAERMLANGIGAEPVFHQPPLYPLAVAAVYALVPSAARSFTVVGLQLLLSSAAIALLVPLGKRLFGNVACGVAAALLALLHAPFVFYALKQLPTTLAVATQLLGLSALIGARRASSPWPAVLAGAAWGVAVLARAEMLLFLPFALWFLVKRPLKPTLAFAAAFLVLAAPATVHNLRQGDFVLVASAGGENLYIGNQAGAEGGYTPLHPAAGDIFSQRLAAKRIAEEAAGGELLASQVSSYWRGRALASIAESPAGWLGTAARKVGRLLHPGDPTDLYSLALERREYLTTLHALPVTPWALLLLGAVGLGQSYRRGFGEAQPLVTLLLVQGAVLLLFFVDTRLRLPFYFLLCPFAGLAVTSAMAKLRDGRPRFAWILGALTLVAIVSGAVATKPTPRDSIRLSSTLSLDGRLDEALEVLDGELAGTEPEARVLDQAGWILQKRGDLAAARERYAQALGAGLLPAQARQTRTRLGGLLEQMGELEAAAAEHDAAIASGHANAGTYFERGMFRLRRGLRESAIADLTEAARLDPTWPAPREALRTLGY